jgi:hypothetical protein
VSGAESSRLWRGRANAFTTGGIRSFSSTALSGTVYEAPAGSHYKAVHFPKGQQVTPNADATPLSITETQDYLGSRPDTFSGPWKTLYFPPITDRDFGVQLANAIKSVAPGKAYAVLFTAQGQGRYATLGPSFIVTSNSDPDTVLQHLRDNHHFAQENSRGTFNDAIICKYRYLGYSSKVLPDIMRSKTPTKRTTSPSGLTRQTLALPLPNFNLAHIHDKLNSLYSDKITRFSLANAHVNRLSSLPKGNRRPIALRRANDQLIAANFDLQRDTSLVEDDWTATRVSDRRIDLSYGNRQVLAYKTPAGHYECTFTDGNASISYTDTPYPVKGEEPGFRRELPAGSLYIQRGRIVKFEEKLGSRRLIHGKKPSSKPKDLDRTKIITADIEALIVNKRTHLPWVAEWYGVNKDGSDRGGVFKYTDFGNNSTDMLKAFWADILKNCRGCIVYFHNWAGYDAFHSLNAMVLLGEELGLTFRPMLHNGKVISIKICELNKVILEVKDSILLCPGSLGSLAKSFKVPCLKGHSPHYFNPMEHGCPDLNYVGPVPAYSFFEPKRTSPADYQAIVAAHPNNDWSWLQNELKYLHSDCVSLHQVLVKFFSGFQDQFALSPLSNCTVPGLAFKTWKSHQVPSYDLQVPDLSRTYDPLFREAYFGGIVDVYRPRVTNGFYYDVNSLYPSAMLRPLPVGDPVLRNLTVPDFLNSKFFGFVKATVQAPSGVNIGLLPLRHQGKLLCPGGTFSGLFFSEELRFALANGYQLISIEFAYSFERHDNVFATLIKRLNSMKVEAQAQGKPALRSLAKLLMNSLYGRFGMHPHNNKVLLATPAQAKVIASAFPITRTIPFTNGYELIDFEPLPYSHAIDSGLVNQADVAKVISEPSTFSQTNVPLAAAITAYSRIIINGYKLHCLNNGIGVYYSDTDSLVTDAQLPADMIHDAELGMLKLEHSIKEGFFIAPKLYWLECYSDKGPYTVSKSRGYGGHLTRGQAEALYAGTAISVNKQKWFRSWPGHTVFTAFDHKLNITGEFSKRHKVLDSSGNWVNTAPIVFNQTPVKAIEPAPASFKGISPTGVQNITAKLMRDYFRRAALLKSRGSKAKSTKTRN